MKGGDFSSFCAGGFTAGICNDTDPVSGLPIHQLVDPANGNAPFLNNQIPIGRISPIAQNILSLSAYPQTNASVLAGNNFFFRSGVNFFNDQGDVKIDYNLSQKDHVFGR